MVDKASVKSELQFIDIKEALHRDIIANVFDLKIYGRTITLIAGPSSAGKTVTAAHFADKVIQKNKTVLYFDTDSHPLISRPDPNLLITFREKNPDSYKKYFKYSRDFVPENFIDVLNQVTPTLIIIDSIYAPFVELYKTAPKERAKQIRHFLMGVREWLYEHNAALILTSQVSKEGPSEIGEKVLYTILGGEGLKHMSDTKWVISFLQNDNKEKRILLIDQQEEIVLKISYGGIIEKAS